MKKGGHAHSFLLTAAVAFSAAAFLVPLVLTVAGAFAVNGKFTLKGYRELLFDCFPFYGMFWHSVFYAVTVTVGAVSVGVLAAFSFRFARFRGKHALYVLYIILMMMPLQVMLLPNYIGLKDMHMINTRAAIIVPLIFSPLPIVILRQYMEGGGTETIEAARLETDSCFKILWHCVIPQYRVCIYAVALMIFSDTWNLVEQPLLYLNDDKKRNLSFFFAQIERYEEAVRYPAAVLFMIPVFLLYLLYHRELRNGLKVNM